MIIRRVIALSIVRAHIVLYVTILLSNTKILDMQENNIPGIFGVYHDVHTWVWCQIHATKEMLIMALYNVYNV